MSTENYTDARVDIRSSMLCQEANVSITRHTGAIRVFTVPGGLSGASPGSRFMEITIGSAVRYDGFEFDPSDDMVACEWVPISIYAAGKTLTTTALIETDAFKHAVNSEAVQDLTLVAKWASWQ